MEDTTVERLRKEAQAKAEMLEARIRDWGIDLRKFRARAAKANGGAKAKLAADAAILRSKLDKAKTRLVEMKKSGDAASAKLARSVGKARDKIRKGLNELVS